MKTQLAHEAHAIGRQGYWLRALRGSWPRAVCRLLEDGEPAVVRALVAEVRGSAPREPGACMLVSRAGIDGTIGGGHLEWQALQAAQALLAAAPAASSVRLRRLVLGRELAQCCGGVVQLWLERFTAADLPLLRQTAARDSGAILTELDGNTVVRRLLEPGAETGRGWQPSQREPAGAGGLQFIACGEEHAMLWEAVPTRAAPLWLYGAGHVGQALIRVLAELPFEVTWIDSRAQLLPPALPDNVRALCAPTPVHTVELAPAAARFLVMTHDHALDYALVRRILERGDLTWLGLIGSKSKGARFRSRLARDGFAPQTIGRLTCPIGVEGVASKWPAAIAVAVAAQLLRTLESPGAGRVPAPAAAELCQSADCGRCASRSA